MIEEKPENSFQIPGNGKGPLANISPLIFIFLSLSVVFFLYQIIGSSITYLILGSDIDINESNVNVTRLIITFAQFMFIFVPTLILVMLQDNNLKETFRLKKPKMSVFALAIIGIFVIQPFLQMFMYYQNEIIFNLPFGTEFLTKLKEIFDTLEASTEKLVTANSIPEFLMIVIVIAVTPAICEEFLFRGLVLKNFEKIISPGKAIFFTGLLFALFHFHPFNLIPLAILGIYLSLIVYHSGSIYTAIAVHFINNFISALAVYIYGTEMIGSEAAANISGSEQTELLIYGTISLIVFIAIIFLIRKNSVADSQQNFQDRIQNQPPTVNE